MSELNEARMSRAHDAAPTADPVAEFGLIARRSERNGKATLSHCRARRSKQGYIPRGLPRGKARAKRAPSNERVDDPAARKAHYREALRRILVDR